MINTSPIIELLEEQLTKGAIYTRLKGAMVSKTQAQKCIKQAYLQGMQEMYDKMAKGEDISDLFQHYVPKERFLKIS